MEWWWVYLAIGAAIGFLAGLFGIGGGMIMVPMLVMLRDGNVEDEALDEEAMMNETPEAPAPQPSPNPSPNPQ